MVPVPLLYMLKPGQPGKLQPWVIAPGLFFYGVLVNTSGLFIFLKNIFKKRIPRGNN